MLCFVLPLETHHPIFSCILTPFLGVFHLDWVGAEEALLRQILRFSLSQVSSQTDNYKWVITNDLKFSLEYSTSGKKKHKEGKKRKKKILKMDKKPEEIALMENFSSSVPNESKQVNGNLRKSPVLRFTCPTPPEQRQASNAEGNGSNLRRKISRSASHIAGFNFEDRRDRSMTSNSLEITQETRKISSSEGNMAGRRSAASPPVKLKRQANRRKVSQGSIFESAFPAVPPLRQTSINPGQKVVQVCKSLRYFIAFWISLFYGCSFISVKLNQGRSQFSCHTGSTRMQPRAFVG